MAEKTCAACDCKLDEGAIKVKSAVKRSKCAAMSAPRS